MTARDLVIERLRKNAEFAERQAKHSKYEVRLRAEGRARAYRQALAYLKVLR